MSSYPHEPPKDLYIYYLDGRVDPTHISCLPCFLGSWEEGDGMSFLFFSKPSLSEVQHLVNLETGISILDVFQMSYAEWHGGQISPFSIGRFHYKPVWEASYIQRDESEIVFDPGVVFGSGWHVTTITCLEALEKIFQQENIGSAIDLGTGSGLLALATAKYGCQRVLAVDLNPLAVSTTWFNIRENGLESRIMPCQAKAEDNVGIPAELLMANIHYDVLQRIVALEEFYLKKWFILSGILRSQFFELRELFRTRPVHIEEVWNEGQVWYTILGKIVS